MPSQPSCSTFTDGVIAAALLLATVGSRGACEATSAYTPARKGSRSPDKAERLNHQAADVIEKDPAKAEALLREALTFDLYNGPAHNNLGTLLLQRGQLYEAAGEFEWARKLLPGHPDPRLNLALTLEMAGRTDDALSTYRTALEVYPDHLPTMQAITRLQIRSNKKDAETDRFLREIAMRGENEQWRVWARGQMVKAGN